MTTAYAGNDAALMRVAIADDSIPFRNALAGLLASIDADVIVSVGTPQGLVEAVGAHRPDVAIVDMRMPPTRTNEGLLAARQLTVAYPGVAVLVVSADDEAPYAAEVLAGAPRSTGYMSKRSVSERRQLRSALTRLLSGRTVADADVVLQLLSHPSRLPGVQRLDGQQRRALFLLAQDYSLAAVAEHLGTSPERAATLAATVVRTLGMDPDAETCREALRWMASRPREGEK